MIVLGSKLQDVPHKASEVGKKMLIPLTQIITHKRRLVMTFDNEDPTSISMCR